MLLDSSTALYSSRKEKAPCLDYQSDPMWSSQWLSFLWFGASLSCRYLIGKCRKKRPTCSPFEQLGCGRWGCEDWFIHGFTLLAINTSPLPKDSRADVENKLGYYYLKIIATKMTSLNWFIQIFWLDRAFFILSSAGSSLIWCKSGRKCVYSNNFELSRCFLVVLSTGYLPVLSQFLPECLLYQRYFIGRSFLHGSKTNHSKLVVPNVSNTGLKNKYTISFFTSSEGSCGCLSAYHRLPASP